MSLLRRHRILPKSGKIAYPNPVNLRAFSIIAYRFRFARLLRFVLRIFSRTFSGGLSPCKPRHCWIFPAGLHDRFCDRFYDRFAQFFCAFFGDFFGDFSPPSMRLVRGFEGTLKVLVDGQ
ncbi:TPA: hypothetical protein RXG82_003272 [Escherichia coli]|uniref:hypothetical protein n=1 Tax=Escherichia coli TaxID=562 RepID=UPI0015E865E7|nr:hypothetical protein [Escherichia coli]HEA6330547.1 hypothetical protein [Escherichia coli]